MVLPLQYAAGLLTKCCAGSHPLAGVKFPDAEEVPIFAQKFNLCEPKVDDAIGFMHGLALATECCSEPVEQNSMYNGYHSDTMVNIYLLLIWLIKYFFVP